MNRGLDPLFISSFFFDSPIDKLYNNHKGRWVKVKNFKIICCLADLHFGNKRVTAEDMKKQLKKHFFDVAKKMKYLDGIFILGDIMHTIVSLNSPYSNLFLWFINKVYKLAKQKGATVIIIKGTPSHDNDQLSNIRSYEYTEFLDDDNVDFRIYEKPEVITVWDDYKMLVLPDVRFHDFAEVESYFAEEDQYDMILGHGLIDTMQHFVAESEHLSMKTYVYEVDKLIRSCKGPIFFGHIHQYQRIRDQFFYVGPFTTLERGCFSAGFCVCGIADDDRHKFLTEYYPNPDSAEYFEFNLTKEVMDDYPIDDIIAVLDEKIGETKPNDLITLRITRGDNKDSLDRIMILEMRYRKDRRISIVKKIKSKFEEESEKRNADRKEKFGYIMDGNLSIAEIMHQYYLSDVLPTIEDKDSLPAKITIDDFKRILKEQNFCFMLSYTRH